MCLSIFLTLLILAALCFAGIVDSVVAVVNGEPVTLSMVEDAMNAIWTGTDNLPKSQESALQKLIDHKLKLQEARRLGADVIVSEERLAREVVNVASRFASQEEATRALEKLGISQKDLEEYLIEEIMIREMIERKFLLFAEVTDIEASTFFEQNKGQFVIAETVLLDQVFFQLPLDADEEARRAKRQAVAEILKNLKEGASFSEYMTAERMNEYVATDQLVPVVAAAIEQIPVGAISNLIETPAGYFIIKLRDRRPERQAVFSDVKTEIKGFLRQQKADEELNAWLENQRKIADIRNLIELENTIQN